MAVTYLIRFDVRAEQRARFLHLLDGVLDAMRGEPTFHQAVLHRDPQSDTTFLLYETWESHDEVVSVQLNRPYRAEWHAALPELLHGPRAISVWEPMRADRGPAAGA